MDAPKLNKTHADNSRSYYYIFFSFHNRVHLIVKEKDKECGRVLKTLLSVVEKRILIKWKGFVKIFIILNISFLN